MPFNPHNTQLKSALALAARGFRLFPLKPNLKEPALSDWQRLSSDKKEKLIEWQKSGFMNFGICCGSSGVFVIDIDRKNGKDGLIGFNKLHADHGFDACMAVKTTSGGYHLYFKNTHGLTNSAGKLAAGIDTRGIGGYVVAPGAVFDTGVYVPVSCTEVGLPPFTPVAVAEYAALPESFCTLAAKRVVDLTEGKTEGLDAPTDVSRALTYLQEKAPTAQEGNRDENTYIVAAACKDYGLSAVKTAELMATHWNGLKCLPAIPTEHLHEKVANAYAYGRNPIGAKSVDVEFPPITMKYPGVNEAGGALFWEELNPATSKVEPRQWLYGKLLLRKKITFAVAPGGAGKSTLTIAMALALASGKDLLNMGEVKHSVVAMFNNEDDTDELKRRILAAMKHYGLTQADLTKDGKPSFYWVGSDKYQLCVTVRNGKESIPFKVDQLTEQLRAGGVDVVIADPFAETHTANENDNMEMLGVGKIYRQIAEKLNAAVLLVHHDRKPANSDSAGSAGNMYSLRGASSQVGFARIIFTVHSMTQKEAKDLGVSEKTRNRYLRLDFGKGNMSLNSTEPCWFYRESVNIGSFEAPESVGVVRPVAASEINEGMSAAQKQLVSAVEEVVWESTQEGMSVGDIADVLVTSFTAFADRKAATIKASILALFSERKTVLSDNGMLELFSKKETRTKHFVRAVDF